MGSNISNQLSRAWKVLNNTWLYALGIYIIATMKSFPGVDGILIQPQWKGTLDKSLFIFLFDVEIYHDQRMTEPLTHRFKDLQPTDISSCLMITDLSLGFGSFGRSSWPAGYCGRHPVPCTLPPAPQAKDEHFDKCKFSEIVNYLSLELVLWAE